MENVISSYSITILQTDNFAYRHEKLCVFDWLIQVQKSIYTIALVIYCLCYIDCYIDRATQTERVKIFSACVALSM